VVIFTFCFKPNPFWWRGVGGLDDVGRWARATPASRERNERDLWVKALKVGVASAGTVTPLCPQPSRCNAMSSELRCTHGKLGRVIWTHGCPLLRLAPCSGADTMQGKSGYQRNCGCSNLRAVQTRLPKHRTTWYFAVASQRSSGWWLGSRGCKRP